MSFDQRIIRFAERFLSERTYHLIVLPAIADLQFERNATSAARAASRLAVLRAVCGGLQDDLSRASGGMVVLAMLPACYYIFLLVMCFDVLSISISSSFLVVACLLLLLSFGPVMACFWPERPPVRPAD
jgi:hypothetical protein